MACLCVSLLCSSHCSSEKNGWNDEGKIEYWQYSRSALLDLDRQQVVNCIGKSNIPLQRKKVMEVEGPFASWWHFTVFLSDWNQGYTIFWITLQKTKEYIISSILSLFLKKNR